MLLRIVVAALLISTLSDDLSRGDLSAVSVVAIGLGSFLTLGLFTVVAAALGAIFAAILPFLHHGALTSSSVTIALCTVLALLGSGAYSIDARLFGPRRVVWPTS
jgi:uncharacterized membrane protein YphA (DoxX/SURF4 family)